jgi:hypothetical protein
LKWVDEFDVLLFSEQPILVVKIGREGLKTYEVSIFSDIQHDDCYGVVEWRLVK